MTLQRQRLGQSAENLAVDELKRQGYAILARRYRTRHGEIDVVAQDGETLVFVEVKARTTGEFGEAAEAVTRWKQRRLVSMAVEYVSRHGLTARACRFDVVAVDGPVRAACGEVLATTLTVYRNAFDA